MSEIEKMYENAGIKPIKQGYCDWDSDCPYPDIINDGCGDECPYWKYEDEAKYPPFTAAKQLELIKFLFNQGVYYSTFPNGTYQFHISDEIENPQPRKFDIAIAEIINDLWQDLTEEERKQIKEILK